MQYVAGDIYHMYNQGNNKEQIFLSDRNYEYFIGKMKKHLLPYVDVLAYCLMPNHFHWLVHVKEEACLPSNMIKPILKYGVESDSYQQILSKEIGVMIRSYTRAINKQEDRSGSLFRKLTKIKKTNELGFINSETEKHLEGFRNYTGDCFNYIHQNPVKAGLTEKAQDWKYSSASDYLGLVENSICNKAMALRFGLNEQVI